MVVVAEVRTALTSLHLGGRMVHLGVGGLKLPTPDIWVGYRGSLSATLMPSAEQLAGLTSTWVASLALTLASSTLGLGRTGNPHVRLMWRGVITGTAVILLDFVVAILDLIPVVLLHGERMMLVEVPMPALALPILILGVNALAVSTMRLMDILRTLPATPQSQTSRRVERTATSSKPGQTPVSAVRAKPSQDASRIEDATKDGGMSDGDQSDKAARVTAAPAGKIAGLAPRKSGASDSGAGTSRGGR